MKTSILFLSILVLAAAEESAIEEFAHANNLFAQNVYKEILKKKYANFLVSPFSAETVLAFTQSGCRGDSAEELRNALHLPNDQNKVESILKSLIPKMRDNGLYTLRTANKMYIKNNFSVKEDFKTAARLTYFSDIESVDFSEKAKAAKTINDWVENETNNKIKNLIGSDDVNQGTLVVLVNALYFKGNWSQKFLTHSTQQKDFYKTPSEVKKVDFMKQRKFLNYYECPHLKAQILELPFRGEDVSMIFILPNEKDGITDLETNLDQVFNSQHQLESTHVNVAIPKFQLETTIDFKGILKSLGVHGIFDPSEADLSGIAGNKGDIYVDKVAQKTFIEVNEAGVEAAAATFVSITKMGAWEGPAKDFIADHPFIFLIKFKNVILFAGKVSDPTES